MRRRILTLAWLLVSLAGTAFAQAPSAIQQGSLSATGSVPLDVRGMGTGSIQVAGTFTGTITFEVSTNTGDYVGIDCATPDDPGTAVNSTTAAGLWTCPVAGLSSFRARMSSYTNGTALVTVAAAATGGGGGSGGGGSGGTQYTEGTTDASITGTALLFEDSDLLVAAPGTAANGLLVDVSRSAEAARFVDDADFIDGTSSLFGIGGVAESASPSAVTEGDIGMFAMTLNRALKVTLFNSSGTELTATEVLEDAPETAGVAGPTILNVRRDVAAASAGTTGDNATFNTDSLGLLWARFLDPCSGVAKVSVPIDIVTATTVEIINQSASNAAYICAIHLVTDAANDVALVEDGDDACASPSGGLAGGFGSAAEGWNFGANGGLALGSGNGTVIKTSGTNLNVCLITSASTQVSGTVVYALAP